MDDAADQSSIIQLRQTAHLVGQQRLKPLKLLITQQ